MSEQKPIDNAMPEERERLERLVAIETVQISVTHLRALKLALKGLYMGTPQGSDLERDVGAAFQQLANIVEWIELRASALPTEPLAPAGAVSPASADGPARLH